MFDCLFYNGKSLLKEPLSERRKAMHEAIKVRVCHTHIHTHKVCISARKDMKACTNGSHTHTHTHTRARAPHGLHFSPEGHGSLCAHARLSIAMRVHVPVMG